MKGYVLVVELLDNSTAEITETVMDRIEFSNFALANDVADDYTILSAVRVSLL